MRDLTDEETRAIRSLKRLARKWPQSLVLFSWSGSLVVMDAKMEPNEEATLDFIDGIPNDGGDPESGWAGARDRQGRPLRDDASQVKDSQP